MSLGTGCWVARCGRVRVPLGLHRDLGALCVSLPLQLLDQELQHELLAHYPAAHSLCHWGE